MLKPKLTTKTATFLQGFRAFAHAHSHNRRRACCGLGDWLEVCIHVCKVELVLLKHILNKVKQFCTHCRVKVRVPNRRCHNQTTPSKEGLDDFEDFLVAGFLQVVVPERVEEG